MIPAGERGSATAWGLSVIVVLVAAVVLGLTLGAAVIQRHQAVRAAELAALAGAGKVHEGTAAACARAGDIARRHDAVLAACDVNGVIVAVEVFLGDSPRGWLGRQALAPARGRARAGPDP